MRLFTAVYPGEAALAHLDLALGALGTSTSDPGPGLRWVPREQRHLTVAFHGEVPTGALEGYLAALGCALGEVEPFSIGLAGGGAFGGRTLYAAVGAGAAEFEHLMSAVEQVAVETNLNPLGVPAARRPHLTLARGSRSRGPQNASQRRRPNRGGRRADLAGPPVADWARALLVYRGPTFEVSEVVVVSSRLGAGRSGGPLHEPLGSVRLGAAGGVR